MEKPSIPYLVKDMSLADVKEVAALEELIFPLPWSARAFEYELRHNPMAHFAVLRPSISDRDRQEPPGVLGYAGFWLIVDEAHICTLGVHPDWRGRGLGELLLAHLIDRATERGAAVVTLEVRVSNLVAQSMYRKYGFVPAGLRRRYYSDNNEDAVIMTTEVITSPSYQRRLAGLKASLWQRLAQGAQTAPTDSS
jgi:ribosomal-protein-alanine N-acetyltransferase